MLPAHDCCKVFSLPAAGVTLKIIFPSGCTPDRNDLYRPRDLLSGLNPVSRRNESPEKRLLVNSYRCVLARPQSGTAQVTVYVITLVVMIVVWLAGCGLPYAIIATFGAACAATWPALRLGPSRDR
jgi:hypothetical protein